MKWSVRRKRGGLEPLKKDERASMRQIETQPGADKQTKMRSHLREGKALNDGGEAG